MKLLAETDANINFLSFLQYLPSYAQQLSEEFSSAAQQYHTINILAEGRLFKAVRAIFPRQASSRWNLTCLWVRLAKMLCGIDFTAAMQLLACLRHPRMGGCAFLRLNKLSLGI